MDSIIERGSIFNKFEIMSLTTVAAKKYINLDKKAVDGEILVIGYMNLDGAIANTGQLGLEINGTSFDLKDIGTLAAGGISLFETKVYIRQNDRIYANIASASGTPKGNFFVLGVEYLSRFIQ